MSAVKQFPQYGKKQAAQNMNYALIRLNLERISKGQHIIGQYSAVSK